LATPWDKITAYVAEIKEKAALEAEIEQEEYSSIENQRLDCIYDDEPLDFENDPMGPAKKMEA